MVLVQPHDSPTCPSHALASLPRYTHALALHDPLLPPLLLVLEELLELVLVLLELLVLVLLELLLLLPPPLQVTGSHSAGTALGVQSGWLVCACRHW